MPDFGDVAKASRHLDGAESKAALNARQWEDARRVERQAVVRRIADRFSTPSTAPPRRPVDLDSVGLNKAQLEAAKAQLADIDAAREHRQTLEQGVLGLVRLTELSIDQDAARHAEASAAAAAEFRQNLRWTRAAVIVGLLGIPIGAVVTLLAS